MLRAIYFIPLDLYFLHLILELSIPKYLIFHHKISLIRFILSLVFLPLLHSFLLVEVFNLAISFV